jgi:menaquinone-specific isochorismate synthase
MPVPAPIDPAGLVARTRRLDGEVDLASLGARPGGVLFEQGRYGLAGQGERFRVPVGQADELLKQIAVDDQVGLPGCGPVAFGALPFDLAQPAELVVPAVVWGRAPGGERWVTTIGPAGPAEEGGSPAPVRSDPAGGPSRFTVEPGRSPASWCELVERATKTMAGPGAELRKVVLARQLEVTADIPFRIDEVVARLRAGYPGCHIVHVDGFVAASPELLVSRAGDVVRSHPMAGTAPRGGDPSADAALAASLLSSTKDREEHQITIDMVQDTLLRWCSYVDYEEAPSVVPVANVQHLATLVEGRLSHPVPSVLELVRALHPTPAVCGSPRETAFGFIAAEEGFDRGRYAGTAGWVDARGNGTWAVSIRCAEISANTARLAAGCGIVVDSDPETELAETRVKFQALLSALVRP